MKEHDCSTKKVPGTKRTVDNNSKRMNILLALAMIEGLAEKGKINDVTFKAIRSDAEKMLADIV